MTYDFFLSFVAKIHFFFSHLTECVQTILRYVYDLFTQKFVSEYNQNGATAHEFFTMMPEVGAGFIYILASILFLF